MRSVILGILAIVAMSGCGKLNVSGPASAPQEESSSFFGIINENSSRAQVRDFYRDTKRDIADASDKYEKVLKFCSDSADEIEAYNNVLANWNPIIGQLKIDIDNYRESVATAKSVRNGFIEDRGEQRGKYNAADKRVQILGTPRAGQMLLFQEALKNLRKERATQRKTRNQAKRNMRDLEDDSLEYASAEQTELGAREEIKRINREMKDLAIPSAADVALELQKAKDDKTAAWNEIGRLNGEITRVRDEITQLRANIRGAKQTIKNAPTTDNLKVLELPEFCSSLVE